MKFSRVIWLIIWLIAVLTNCSQPGDTQKPVNKKWKSETSGSQEVNRQIEQIKAEIKRLYSTNPDSAIIYYLKAIDLYKKHHMPYNTFDAYIKISELYCFRKNDGINAVYYYGEALKTMNKNGGFEDSDPFFFIDMGNMFYMHQLYAQAHQSYDKAINIATNLNDQFATSVAMNNKGLVFREEDKFDDSKSCFRRSLAIRKKIIYRCTKPTITYT